MYGHRNKRARKESNGGRKTGPLRILRLMKRLGPVEMDLLPPCANNVVSMENPTWRSCSIQLHSFGFQNV